MSESDNYRDVAKSDHRVDAAVDLDGIDPDVYAKRWKTLAVLCASLVIVIVGNTVLNVALPTLQRPSELGGLGASNTAIQWIVDAYGLVFAGLLFTAGAIGDRFGRKGALQGGLGVFVLGSLIGAFADTSAMLIASRAIMGAGAAFIMPSTLSILTNVFPSRERAKAIAIWAGVSGSGAAIGPLASGFLLEHFWWGSVFLVNIPIIVLAIVAGRLLVPKSRDSEKTPLDPVGALLSIGGFSSLVYAIIEGPHNGWTSTTTLMWFAVAVVALTVFAMWEWRVRHPMLDLRLFRNRTFSVSAGGITLVFFAMFGTFFLLAQYLQGVSGYSPLGAAIRMLPFSAIMMIVAPQTPRWVAKFGAHRVAATGMVFTAAGLAGTSIMGTGTPYAQQISTWSLLAAGMALTMSPMTTGLMASVPRNRAGMGSAMNDTTRELGGALGVAVLGSLLGGRYTSGVDDVASRLPDDVADQVRGGIGAVRGLIDQGVISGEAADRLLAQARQAFVDGQSLAAITAAGVVLVAAVFSYRYLPRDRNLIRVGAHDQAELGLVDVKA